MRGFARLLSLAGVILTAAARPAAGQVLTPGNFLASVNEFTGSSTAPRYIAEYTPSGVRVQVLPAVPLGTETSERTIRDLTVGPGNSVHLYNGTFAPNLATLNRATGAWSQRSFAEWSTVNNITYGGLSQFGQYVFATDMGTASGGAASGVVRFDTLGGPTVRFATDSGPIDLEVGPGGTVYALDAPNTVRKYDALALTSTGTVALDFEDNRAVAVADDGSIYVATFAGRVKRFSAAGTLVDSLTVSGANFSDIDIGKDGRIVLGTGFDGEVVVTDLGLDAFTRFRVTDSTLGGDVFVTWVPVPEPTGVGFGVVVVSVLAGWARRRKTHSPRTRPVGLTPV